MNKRVGKIVYNTEKDDDEKTDFIQKIQNKVSPYIDRNKLSSDKLLKWIMKISQWQVKQVSIDDHQQKRLLKAIQNINFPDLTRIVLWKNNIESFESLSRVNFPLIKTLNLDDNNVRSIRNIRKMHSPNLDLLQISSNPIVDSQKLTQCKMSQMLVAFSLDYSSDFSEVGSSPGFCLKLQCKSISQLRIASVRRIVQPKLFEKLKSNNFHAEVNMRD